jgi:predicted DNA-binding transcriptional regulator AlpA
MKKRFNKNFPLFGNRLAILVSTARMAELLDISETHLRDLLDENKTPEPVWLGRCMRWNVKTMEAWADANCPDRPTWENMKLGKEVVSSE